MLVSACAGHVSACAGTQGNAPPDSWRVMERFVMQANHFLPWAPPVYEETPLSEELWAPGSPTASSAEASHSGATSTGSHVGSRSVIRPCPPTDVCLQFPRLTETVRAHACQQLHALRDVSKGCPAMEACSATLPSKVRSRCWSVILVLKTTRGLWAIAGGEKRRQGE